MSSSSTKSYVTGFADLSDLLKSTPKDIERKVLQYATRKALKTILPKVRAAAPKSTGKRSKNSLKYGRLFQKPKLKNIKSRGKGIKGTVIHTGTAFYGKFLELGTRRIAPRPFIRDTFDSNVNSMTQVLEKEIYQGMITFMQKKRPIRK